MASQPISLVDAVYEAGAAPELWPTLLQRLGRRFDAIGGQIFRLEGDDVRFLSSPVVREVMEEFVAQGWMAQNDRVHRALALNHPGFFCDTDFHTEEVIAELPMYRDFLAPRGMIAAAGSAIPGASGDKIILTVEGFPTHAASRAALTGLDELRPHLARALVLSSQLQLQQARAMAAALGAVGAAAGVLGPTGRLRAANPLLERRLGRSLQDRRTRLAFTDGLADRLLEEALGKIRAGGGGRSIALPARSAEESPAVLHVLPVRGQAQDVFAEAAVIVVLAHGRPGAPPNADLLACLFDLTPAEANVAREITAGRTVAEIAQAHTLSRHTIRNQLKAVFAKVGVDRQAELATLLNNLAPPNST